ncbi:hypothetical protein SAY87_024200 [Trapa incisa]|uniref:Uncharacterized protein n=2 Tax=Trapa TaxID=22665 RepID=A0AAN7QGY9_TRANT|nr:hypothetical protein SAY86_015392 [Trapa natans]KAK4776239.1 hypothetical protein SAY87_024200 [Trapa incisa]
MEKRQNKRQKNPSSIPTTMADINGSLLPGGTHELQALFHALDPTSLIISENSRFNDIDQPLIMTPSSLSPDMETCFVMERGPRYRAYSELREEKLRKKHMGLRQPEPGNRHHPIQTPPIKQVKFQGSSVGDRKGSSILTQSVPDFSSIIRKENRKPVNALPPLLEMTPPTKNWTKVNHVGSSVRGSKSVNAGEKKGGMTMVRKSYACMEELKGLSSAAINPIGGGNRIGGKSLGGTRRTVLGSRAI